MRRTRILAVLPDTQTQQPNTMTIDLTDGSQNTFDPSITSYKIVNVQTTIPELASGEYKGTGFDSISVIDTSVYGSFTINVSTETATSVTTKPNHIFVSLPIDSIQTDKATGQNVYTLKSSFATIAGHPIKEGKLTADGNQGQLVITVS